MKRTLVALVAMLTVLFASVGPAAAQDQTLTVEPASVAEAGEHEFTITASGFNPTPGFLLPCPGAEGSLETIADGDPATLCDLANLFPYTVDDDGGWTATVSYDIPDIGLVVAAGDTGGDNAAAALISVGAEEEAAEEEAEEEEAAEEAEAATTSSSEGLAETGTESAFLVIIGATMLLAGLMMYRSSRVFSRL